MTTPTMVSVLRTTNSLERAGKLGPGTNPQILAAVMRSRAEGAYFSAVRAAEIFNRIVEGDSQPPLNARLSNGRVTIVEL